MSRKALSIVVGTVGTLMAIAMWLGMSLFGSLLADARTEHLAGPGVDVFLRTPYPEVGSLVVLEVAARGGSKAGIYDVTVTDGTRTVLAKAKGEGVTWGGTISGRGGRGEDSAHVSFRLPDDLKAGDKLPVSIDVNYVTAMSSGGRFTNDRKHGIVKLTIEVYSPGGRTVARLLLGGEAMLLFAVWFALVWGIAGLYARAAGQTDATGSEMEGIGLLMGVMGGGFVGYWFFARMLMAVAETTDTVWGVLLTIAWVVIPLVWVWRWWKRRPKLSKYRLAFPGRPDAPREVDADELVGWLRKELSFVVKRTGQSLRAKRPDAELRVRWSGSPVTVDAMVIETNQSRAAIELAHCIAGRLGKLALHTPTGYEASIDVAETVDEIEKAYDAWVMAETERLLAAIRGRMPRAGA